MRNFFFLSVLLVSAAQAAPTALQSAQAEFVGSCLESFKNSSAPASAEISQLICDCVAKDAPVENVSVASLKSEAEKIKKDPKYQIQNEGLMNAFRYCTIELMRKADTSSGAPSKK